MPLADLNDIVFGGWDIFPDNAYEAAMYAEVLKEKDLNLVKDELQAIKPMPAAFDHNFAKRLNGTHIKKAATRWEMTEQLREDIRNFKAANNCERIAVLWAASTEIYIPLSKEHESLAALEQAMKETILKSSLRVCAMHTLPLQKALRLLWVLLIYVWILQPCGNSPRNECAHFR